MFRQKSYSAETGYVYQYYYEARQDAEGGSRYIFHATADRKRWFPLVIFVPDAVLYEWEQRNRKLTLNERYAISKLSLMRAFDNQEPAELLAEVRVCLSDVEEISEILGLL